MGRGGGVVFYVIFSSFFVTRFRGRGVCYKNQNGKV